MRQALLRNLLDTTGDQKLSFISIHLQESDERVIVECAEPPGHLIRADAPTDDFDLASAPSPSEFPGATAEARRDNWVKELQERQRNRHDQILVRMGRLATLNTRRTLTPTEALLQARSMSSEDFLRFSTFEGLADIICV